MRIKFIFSSNIQVVVLIDVLKFTYKTVADPGLPSGGGGRNSQNGCLNLLFCKFFFRKLHENERIWNPKEGGGRTSLASLWIRQCKTMEYEMVHFISDTEK